MNKVSKKILAIALSFGMIFEGVSFCNRTVEAYRTDSMDLKKMISLNDPEAFILDHTDFEGNHISGTIYAGEGQENCTYTIFMDGIILAENLSAGEFYIDDVPGGEHSINCKTYSNGKYSNGNNTVSVYLQEIFYYECYTDTDAFVDSCKLGFNYVTRNGSLIPGVQSMATSQESLNPVSHAIDGDMDTFWESEGVGQEWYQIDLGRVKPILAVCILWGTDSAKDYSIQLSEDGKNFQTAAYVTDVRTWENPGYKDEVKFDYQINGRYIRIRLKEGFSNESYGIREIAAYGSEEKISEETTGGETTSEEPTTVEITTEEPATEELTTTESITNEPTTIEGTTGESTTVEPTTLEPITKEQTTVEVTTEEFTTEDNTTKEAEITKGERLTTNAPQTVVGKSEQTTKKEEKPLKIKKASVKKVEKKSAKKITGVLNKTNGAAGYQVAVYKNKKTAKNNKTPILTKTIVKLKFSIISKKFKNRKKLYVRVRAYKKQGKKKVYGAWSNAVQVK